MKIAIFVILGIVVVCVVGWVIAFVRYRARMQPYNFAHQLLPSQLFAEPVAVLAPMISSTGFSDAGREHLLQFWEAAGEGQSGTDLVPSDSLTYSMEVLGHPNSTAFLIQLPPPEKKTEAHFILMVFDGPGLVSGTLRQLRYFVLEYYGQKNGVPETRLGEWVPKENGGLKYADHGAGPPPEKEAFLARVQEIVEPSGQEAQDVT